MTLNDPRRPQINGQPATLDGLSILPFFSLGMANATQVVLGAWLPVDDTFYTFSHRETICSTTDLPHMIVDYYHDPEKFLYKQFGFRIREELVPLLHIAPKTITLEDLL